MRRTVQLRYFGLIAEQMGVDSESRELELETTEALISQLEEEHFMLRTIPYRIAHNQSLINSSQALEDGDEIALLPPFAGG